MFQKSFCMFKTLIIWLWIFCFWNVLFSNQMYTIFSWNSGVSYGDHQNYVCLRKLCLLAECKIWALRNLLGIHKAPLKLVILELGCCFTAPVSITFTHSVISTTVMATLAAGNVILLDLMAAALTLAGPLAVLQLFDELAKQDLLEKVKSGWDTLQVFSLFSFSLYTLHIHKGLLLCFQKKSLKFFGIFCFSTIVPPILDWIFCKFEWR